MSAIAIADDGHVLGQHICSHEGYMRHDLGMDGSNWKHENYDKHFGKDGWELIWMDDHNAPEIQAACALNAKLPKEAIEAQKEAAPKIEVTFSP